MKNVENFNYLKTCLKYTINNRIIFSMNESSRYTE